VRHRGLVLAVSVQQVGQVGVQGLADIAVESRSTCVDSKRQWRHAGNVWRNSMVRSVLQTIAAPVTGLGRMVRGSKSQA
jgi:hypothetical protein